MTQPIQEPGPSTRTDARATWATNQLFRRPPPNQGEIWPWVTLVNAGQTLPTGTGFVPSYFQEAYWDPAITSDPTVGGGIFFVDEVTHSGTDYWQLYLNTEGWYMFEMVHSIDDLTNWSIGEYFQQEIAQPAGTPFSGDDRMGTSESEALVNGSQEFIETYRTIWAISTGTQQLYEAAVRQTSGVDKDVFGHVKVWYLGGVGGSTNNADWEVAVIT